MGVILWIIFIVSIIIAVIIVNKVQQLYMKMIGADRMYFSGKKKLIAIGIIAILLTSFVVKIFGIEIPN